MFAGKEVRVLLKGQAKESYTLLQNQHDKESETLLRSIERMKDLLKTNPQYGDPMRKELIPQEFKLIGVQNLYRVELSHFWRMLYTIEGNDVEILVFILTIMDHKEYDQLLGYKKK